MNEMTRWEPYRELETMRRMMENFFSDTALGLPSQLQRREGFGLALDVAENADAYIVKASLPGVNPNDVDITLTDNVLTIRGQTQEEKETKETNYHLRERRTGSFSRSITLPNAVEADKIEAVNENGVLTLTLPKAEAVKPRKIAVKQMVNGHTS